MWALGCLLHYTACLEPAFSTQIAERSPRNHYNLSNKQKLEDIILNATPKMIPDFYSNNLRIIIGRLLDKDPQNRPSSDEMISIVQTEYRASSSFESQIFGATSGSGMGMLTSRIQKPQISEYPAIRSKRSEKPTRKIFADFKLPEMTSTNNSKKRNQKHEIAPLKLPGLSISTQASTNKHKAP